MSDIERIIKYMRENGSITCKECEKNIGTTELRRRIRDIKDQGYDIGDAWEDGENRVGVKTRYKRYFIIKGPEGPKEPQKEQPKKRSLWDRLKKIKDLTYTHKNGSMDIIGIVKPKPQKIDITVKIEGE